MGIPSTKLKLQINGVSYNIKYHGTCGGSPPQDLYKLVDEKIEIKWRPYDLMEVDDILSASSTSTPSLPMASIIDGKSTLAEDLSNKNNITESVQELKAKISSQESKAKLSSQELKVDEIIIQEKIFNMISRMDPNAKFKFSGEKINVKYKCNDKEPLKNNIMEGPPVMCTLVKGKRIIYEYGFKVYLKSNETCIYGNCSKDIYLNDVYVCNGDECMGRVNFSYDVVKGLLTPESLNLMLTDRSYHDYRFDT